MYEKSDDHKGGVAWSWWRGAHETCWMLGGEIKSIFKNQMYS